jgi:hypothetical protein
MAIAALLAMGTSNYGSPSTRRDLRPLQAHYGGSLADISSDIIGIPGQESVFMGLCLLHDQDLAIGSST